MKFPVLIVAIVVLLALSGVLYWSNHRKATESNSTSSSATSPAILKMDQAGISQITLARRDAPPITLTKDAAHTWRITEPRPLDADQDAVSSLLGSVSSLNADRVIDEKASDLKPYGLDQPADAVDITAKDGTRKLLIGDQTPAGQDVYAMLQGDPKVYTIANYNKTSIDKGLDDFRNKKLFDFGFQDPNKIELRAGAKSWLLTRIGSDWLSDGKKMDPAAVDSLLEKLRDLTATGFPDSGFGSSAFESTVTSDGGKRVEKVLISKAGDKTIARRENAPALYELPPNSVSDLTTAAEGLKPR